MGSTARGREWDFQARSGRWKWSLAPELGTKVKKKDLKQRELSHQMQTLQGCKSWSWGGHFPMTQRKSVFISFQRNCWVFLAPKELRAKVTGVKQQDFPFFFFFFGKRSERRYYKELWEVSVVREDKVMTGRLLHEVNVKPLTSKKLPETLTFYCRDCQTTGSHEKTEHHRGTLNLELEA